MVNVILSNLVPKYFEKGFISLFFCLFFCAEGLLALNFEVVFSVI